MGGWRYAQNLKQVPRPFEKQIGEELNFSGVIIKETDRRENTTLLTFRDQKTKAIILLTASPFEGLNYGDEVKVNGKLTKPKNFITNSGREFDYVNYLLKDGVAYQMFYPKIEWVKSGQGAKILGGLFKFKNYLLAKMAQVIPEPEVSLLGGLLLGAKQGLGEEIQTDFRRAGVIHIVVLSGYNIAVFAGAISRGLAFLPRVLGIFGAGVGVLSLVLMAGAGTATVRAGLMAGIALFALLSREPYNAGRALFLAGLVMVWWNPLILFYDLGFQLSFISTLGLIYLSPIFAKILKCKSQGLGIKAVLVTTLSAQIMVTPWLIYKTGELSLVALPANLLVVSLVPFTMALGALTGLLALIFIPLAWPMAQLTFWLLHFQLKLAEWFADWPLAVIYLSSFSLWLSVGLYVLISWGYLYFKNENQNQ